MRLAFIGDGAIARSVQATLAQHGGPDFEVIGVLSKDSAGAEPCCAPFVGTIEGLLDLKPDVVVECAGHSALRDLGVRVLSGGVTLMAVSIGALADADLLVELEAAARAGKTRLLLSSGAVGGLDALKAARLGGLTTVRYRGRKPPQAWKGTPAEERIDLGAVGEPTVFFRGNARDAALTFPQNANVAATIALGGVGFEATEVELVADPGITRNIHEVFFEGGDGAFSFTLEGRPSATNPKTSALTAHSIAQTLMGLRATIVF